MVTESGVIRPVIVTDAQHGMAKQIMELSKLLNTEPLSLIWPEAKNLTAARRNEIVRFINCVLCGAAPYDKCRTIRGNLTRNHQQRVTDSIACFYAMGSEPVIKEELDVEEMLAAD